MRFPPGTLALLILAAPALAQGAPTPEMRGALFQGLPPLLQQSVAPDMARATFETRIGAMFAYLDANGDGVLDGSDAVAYEGARAAKVRASVIAALTAFDTDGDGRISEAEIFQGLRRGLPLPPGQERMDTNEATAKGVLWALDANHDGNVDYDEMRSAPTPPAPANPVEAFLALAPKGRESLTADEAKATALTVVFDLLDANGDGVVDGEEFRAALPRAAGR